MRVAGFLALIVLADLCSLSLGLKYWMPRRNGKTLNVFVYQQRHVAADVLFVGSSRMLRAATPQVVAAELDKALGRRCVVFNVGQLGTRLFANALLLRDILASNLAPDVVVVEVSVGALDPNHGDVADGLMYYSSLTDILRSVKWIRSPKCAASAAAGAFRGFANLVLYGHHILFPHGLARGLDRIFARGGGVYGPDAPDGGALRLLPPEKRREKLAFIRSQGRFWTRHPVRFGGAALASFDAIRREVANAGARLVVVNPPVTRTLREEGYPSSLRTAYERYLRQRASAEGFVYRNLDTEITDLTDDDFMDFGHVNAAGSRKVSRYLARRVLAPLLAESRP